ncbi:MAG: PucR family transcriptional regulator [Acidimicrobiales bacterium]
MNTKIAPGNPSDLAARIELGRVHLAKRVGEVIDSLVDAMLVAYRSDISSYADLADPAIWAEVRHFTRANVATVLSTAVASDASLDAAAIAPLRELGRRRSHQGFPLAALLRAYQVGTRVAWEFVLDKVYGLDVEPRVAAEIVRAVSIALLETTAQITQAVAESFAEAEREVAAVTDRARRDCFDELCSGEQRPGLAERATAVGYRLGSAHVVAVVAISDAGDPDDPRRETLLRQVHQAMTEIRPVGASPLLDLGSQGIRAIFAVTSGMSEAAIADGIAKHIDCLDVPASGAIQAGVGMVATGLAGIAMSHRQALQALAVADRRPGGSCIRRFGDALPELVVAADRELASELFRTSIAPLVEADATQSADLVATLDAYFQCRANLTATAQRLYLHRHTVTARLERIASLTGRDLSRRHDAMVLELGLLAAHALDMLPTGGAGPLTRSPAWPLADAD